MQAAVVREPGLLEVGAYDDPSPRPGDVVVELRAAALSLESQEHQGTLVVEVA